MHEPLTSPLEAWEAFYVIVGSSAAALTGPGVALLLLFVGIHNAWDSVTYVAVARLHAPPETPEAGAPPGQ